MALWGITDADEAKPKWLTTAQKKEVFANNSGWVVEAGSTQTGNDNTDAQPEVLCCVGDLATGIGAADITEIEFITTAFDKSDGGNIDVRVRFNFQLPMETKVLEQVEDHILLHTYQDQLQMNLYSDVQLLLLTLQQMLMMS